MRVGEFSESALSPLRRVTDEHGMRDVPRGALGKPRFLDLQLPHAADGTRLRARVWHGRRGGRVHRRARLSGLHRALPEEFPTPRELDLAPPIREEPISAAYVGSRAGRHGRRNRRIHATASSVMRRWRLPMGLVFPPKVTRPSSQRQQPTIGDRHAMGIAREITPAPAVAQPAGGSHTPPMRWPGGASGTAATARASEGVAVPLPSQVRLRVSACRSIVRNSRRNTRLRTRTGRKKRLATGHPRGPIG